MQDKRRLLTSREIGKDEDSNQSLQKKLEALHLEVEAFKAHVERLAEMSKSLVERQHYDASNVEIKQVNFETKQFSVSLLTLLILLETNTAAV